MAHHVRVLRNPSYQTIRMHYANCNTYNADFDGDEINCHLPQSEVRWQSLLWMTLSRDSSSLLPLSFQAARAEANLIAFTNEQYLVPTDGSPLRGLIQDSVDAGVKLSSMDAWLTRDEYQQLVFQALAGLPGLELCPPEVDIQILPPAILKPKQLWSGKQVRAPSLALEGGNCSIQRAPYRLRSMSGAHHFI
jgi:DNA-directed RNA polymerase I subunit RPA1